MKNMNISGFIIIFYIYVLIKIIKNLKCYKNLVWKVIELIRSYYDKYFD